MTVPPKSKLCPLPSVDFSNVRIGELTKNTNYGVYGKYDDTVDLSEAVVYEIAAVQDIQRGFCQLICTVEGEKPAVYSAEITRIPQTYVKLTDETDIKNMNKLLEMLDEDDDVQNVYHNWEE